jgi:HSP20 family molecular chaperone IbpA
VQNQTATRPQPGAASDSHVIDEIEKLFDDKQELYQSIAWRAYEFYETLGHEGDSELAGRLRTESELLSPVPAELSELPDRLVVRAEVPGFGAHDLNVSVEPRRLVIVGITEEIAERSTGRVIYTERRTKRIFRALTLPAEVDPSQAVTVHKDGVLKFKLPKVNAGRFTLDE